MCAGVYCIGHYKVLFVFCSYPSLSEGAMKGFAFLVLMYYFYVHIRNCCKIYHFSYTLKSEKKNVFVNFIIFYYFNPTSAGAVFIRQNLTSVDVRF